MSINLTIHGKYAETLSVAPCPERQSSSLSLLRAKLSAHYRQRMNQSGMMVWGEVKVFDGLLVFVPGFLFHL